MGRRTRQVAIAVAAIAATAALLVAFSAAAAAVTAVVAGGGAVKVASMATGVAVQVAARMAFRYIGRRVAGDRLAAVRGRAFPRWIPRVVGYAAGFLVGAMIGDVFASPAEFITQKLQKSAGLIGVLALSGGVAASIEYSTGFRRRVLRNQRTARNLHR